MSENTLKPCPNPWCEKMRLPFQLPALKKWRTAEPFDKWSYVCSHCGVEGPVCATPELALAAWNTRPTPDTGIGQGEAVKLAIDVLEKASNALCCNKVITAQACICEAIDALKASPSSAPALKQEAEE